MPNGLPIKDAWRTGRLLICVPSKSEVICLKKRKTLKRERVNRALSSIFEYPLTIVEAPMGYGKTTAVREFLAASGVPVMWTAFYSDGDSTDAFWERVAAESGAPILSIRGSIHRIRE